MKKYKWWEEDAPVNATGTSVAGTGDDDSTVVVKKKIKVYRRKRKMSKEEIEEVRDYRKEYDEYHAKPEQRERNAARLRARRQMEKWGKVKKFDKKDVHHKDNNPLNNEKDNLAVTTQNWNRSEPRLRKEEMIDEWGNSPLDQAIPKYDGRRQIPKKNNKKKSYGKKKKEEVGESINIEERELTPNELKRREEIAKDLDDAAFKKRYGDRWKEVKMGVATNLAKGESVEEADMKKDPKADKEKGKLLKVKKAIAQAQLDVAKEQERIQKLTDLQTKITQKASQAKKEETIMSKKYLETKTGSLEEATLGIWTDAAEELGKLNLNQEGFSSSLVKKAIKIATQMGGDMTGAWKKIEKIKRGLGDDPAVQAALKSANEQKEEGSKVDGRTKSYKETLRRIKMRQEKRAKSQEQQKVEEGKGPKKGYFRMPNGEDVWVDSNPNVLPRKWAKKVEAGKIDATKMDWSGKPSTWKEEIEEASGGKEEYQKFVKTMLKKFGVSSPAELEGDKKKEFYDALDAGWEGDNEKPEKGDKKEAFSEKIEFVEYKFRNKNEAVAAKKFFDAQQRMGFEVNDDNISNGELAVDAGKNDMTKYHEAIIKKLKPKVVTKENEKKK